MASCYVCKEYFNFENNENRKSKQTYNSNSEIPMAPKETSYEISVESISDKNKIGSTIKKIQFFHKDFPIQIYPWIKKDCFSILKSDSKTRLVVLRVVNSFNNNEDKQTILYSHENSSDLGDVYGFMVDLATQMKVIKYCYFFFRFLVKF